MSTSLIVNLNQNFLFIGILNARNWKTYRHLSPLIKLLNTQKEDVLPHKLFKLLLQKFCLRGRKTLNHSTVRESLEQNTASYKQV